VVVVWDGDPDPGRLAQYDVSEYLTPADWSVMLTLAVNVGEVPQITILDFASQRHRTSRSLQRFRQLLRMNPSPLPHVREINPIELKEFFCGLSAPAPRVSPNEEDRLIVRTLWNSLLSGAKGGHHDIANIIGPSLLLESMGHAGGGGPISSALRKLIGVLRGSSGESGRAPERWLDFAQINKWADAVVLIDDLAEEGWRGFLTAALGIEQEGSINVRVYLSPYDEADVESKYVLDIPAYIEERLEWLESAGFGDPPSLVPDAKCPLIFLDIRLFSHRSWKEERDFYKSLLRLAERFAKQRVLAWPVDISPAALKSLMQFLESDDSERESSEHHAALSLLPLLLAIADPTLPIVLFSSTGRRRIIEPLIPCGNIIFDFEKPGVTDDWRDSVDRARLGFKRAVNSALSLLQVRRYLHEVTAAAAASRQEMIRFLAADRKPANRWKYAEIYIDETGPGPDYVGGYVVLYADPKTGPASLYHQLRDQQLLWGSSREETRDEFIERQSQKIGTYPKAGGPPAVPNVDLEQRISSTEALLKKDVLCAACVLKIGDNHKFTGFGDFPDLIYRETASALIELFLFDWLGNMAQVAGLQNTLEAGVFVATRMWKPNALKTLIDAQWNYGCRLQSFNNPSPGEANAHVATMGNIQRSKDMTVGHLPNNKAAMPSTTPDSEVLARTMEPPDVYRIVNAMSGNRPLPVKVRRAIAVTMTDGTREPSVERPFRPLQIHYASDDFLGFLRRNADGWREIPALSDPLDHGFYGVADDSLHTLLRASRRMDAADGLAEGLYCLHHVWRRDDLKGVNRLIATRAAERTKMISGSEFLQLAYLLSQVQVR
jgi:hypothetical protein